MATYSTASSMVLLATFSFAAMASSTVYSAPDAKTTAIAQKSATAVQPAASLSTTTASMESAPNVIAIPEAPMPSASLSQSTSALPTEVAVPGNDQPILIPKPPATSAKAYLLIDANNGVVLAQKDAEQRMEPASLTKMMSLYVISNALKSGKIHFEDQVRISEHAWRTGGSRMFLKVDDTVSVKDLIQGIVVDSGNDACVAMAEYIGGSEAAFTDLMNQTAARLGMRNTHYTDSTGLPNPDLYTTATDMSILARALLKHFPEYYPWYSQKTFTYNKITQPNRNRLLWRDPSVDGMKTGHTDSAGFCLVASAKRQDMRLITVVLSSLNDNTRTNDTEALLTYGFRFFESHKLYTAGTQLAKPRVWFGKSPYANIGVVNDLSITVPAGQYKNLKAQLVLDNTELHAPLSKGAHFGKLQVSLNGKELLTVPLAVLEDVPAGGLWARSIDHLAHMFHRN